MRHDPDEALETYIEKLERERDEALAVVGVARFTLEQLAMQVDAQYLAPLACLEDLRAALAALEKEKS